MRVFFRTIQFKISQFLNCVSFYQKNFTEFAGYTEQVEPVIGVTGTSKYLQSEQMDEYSLVVFFRAQLYEQRGRAKEGRHFGFI